VLLFNPMAGRRRELRLELVEGVAEALRKLGHGCEVVATRGAGTAGEQAREAARDGAGVVFACGGDGTVHEVLQGLAGEGAALGVLPLGSANTLGRHLELPLDPVEAALQQVRWEARMVPVGRVEFGGGSRYFLVMAGAGPDGALVYSLLTGQKAGMGRMAYYVHALRLFLSRRFRAFEVEYVEAESGAKVAMKAVCAMAVRVKDMGGIFRGLAGGGVSLDSSGLNLLIVRGPARLSLPVWFVSGWLRLGRFNPLVKSVEVTEFSCQGRDGDAVHCEADGEWLGRIPMRVSLIADGVRMLLPPE
jgi:diacylglycerol kinase (ATP)